MNVKGRCLACGEELLFLDEGYVTCAGNDCPNPDAVDQFLSRPPHHVVEFKEEGWQIQHEVTCFPDLFACRVHRLMTATFSGPGEALVPPHGRYVAEDGPVLRLRREA